MMTYNVIKELEITPSTNDKIALLMKHRSDEDLRQFFFMALNPNLMYGIKKIPAYRNKTDKYSLALSMMELFMFSSREKTGNDAIDHLTYILENTHEFNVDLIKRIIKKDPDCGVSYKLVNKVWKKLIPITPYMRCASANESNYERVNFPSMIQKKADGLFINTICKEAAVFHQSRNGKPMDLLGKLDADVLKMLPGKDFVIMGEGLVLDGLGGILDRKTGNGIISKAIHGTITEDEANHVIIEIWDIIPFDAWEAGEFKLYGYNQRFSLLQKIYSQPEVKINKIRIIETATVNSMDDANLYFRKMVDRGEEGAILKNMNGTWKNGTSNDCVKMKIKDPADLICVGTVPHTKRPELIGALELESAEGIIKVKTGSGLTDFDRSLSPDSFIGQIIEIEYNDITEDKKTGQKSLFLPIYVGVRDDKTEADSYELIRERSTQNKNK